MNNVSEGALEEEYMASIVFTKKDFKSITILHVDPFIIKTRITNAVSRVLVDQGVVLT